MIADISFEQAVFGDEIEVSLKLPTRCGDCDGSGAGEGTQPVTCSDCGGSGQVQRVRQSLLGQMVTASPCNRCGGLGQIVTTPCATCRGEGRVTSDKTYQVDVPAGVDSDRRCASRVAVRSGREAAAQVICTSICGSLRTAPSSATTTTWSPRSRSRSPRRRSAPRSNSRHSTAPRPWSCRRAPNPDASSCCGSGACHICVAAVAVTCEHESASTSRRSSMTVRSNS